MISCGVRATKKREFNIYTMVESVMLYAFETWRLIERSKRVLKATKMNAFGIL